MAGESHELEPGTAVYLTAGETYEIDNPGSEELVIVSATAPQSAGDAQAPTARTVRYADQPTLPASGDREFRYLVTDEVGCQRRDAVLRRDRTGPRTRPQPRVRRGDLRARRRGRLARRRAGPAGERRLVHSHLPPFFVHSLENSGDSPMRIVATFHPSGDPASRAYEAND